MIEHDCKAFLLYNNHAWQRNTVKHVSISVLQLLAALVHIDVTSSTDPCAFPSNSIQGQYNADV
jgi:hypothetical protein